MERMRIAVLISGSGSNLQAIIDACEKQQINGDIVAVISNRPNVYGLERAEKASIETVVLDHKEFESREAYDSALMEKIDTFTPDLVVLAGFMRILTPGLVQKYKGQMLNIHPSLLPKYQGLNTHQRAIDAGDKEHGVSVHFVTEELDGGPVVLQAKINILPDDTADSLAKRIHQKEHIIYPLVVQWFSEQRLTMEEDNAVFNNKKLPAHGADYA
ncbi:phosphoribosylglycinamide formyltransferase [Pseudoalteromonas denitrificans]|uniref:Phosphoribosylglycinamide formyltransferase n=1 Tax=Pseudoalteromonas denitrificans DSM 6059 TaxID=1123010 RepID=A0A1I1L5K1_9GAMM|nr:phosphoribosylglycinamide formyltransferase [Pseudoalteromonas denitrificans]SFC65703.1 phosphoribosylglycinamide formyltransferase-1 [Pseudoalteromonas denitrificans DSM 6059]